MTSTERRRPGKRRFPGKLTAYVVLGVITVVFGLLVALHVIRREPGSDAERILAAYREAVPYDELTVRYPLDETLFPPEIAPPAFRWTDSRKDSHAWVVTIEFEDDRGPMSFLCPDTEWTPSRESWETIKQRSLETKAKVTILGVNSDAPQRILSAGSISISTSRDEVAAPLFYREVNLPFEEAVKDPAAHIRWRFGTISSGEPPPIVLEKLPVCGNCHSFSADGSMVGMDVDYANDKGSYVTQTVAQQMTLEKSSIISWSEYRREDQEPTFGLLSQVSPDGRYVVSTVKDRSVFVAKDDLEFSQLFFPIKGILVVYDRKTGSFQALPGADDKRFVQSNPTWSPDGKQIVFARSEAHRLENLASETRVLLTPAECREFLEDGKTFLFDLYRIPFNDGKGGRAEPIEGASNNGMSNYFPKYSPDGRWIVFCKAKSFMLLQPGSELYIIPAEGGEARRLRCNTDRMNSWHSWSPNGKWLVFSSKANSPYTQLVLTHIDRGGHSTPPVLLSWLTAADRAANIPEFVNAAPDAIKRIREAFLDEVSYIRAGNELFDHGDHRRAAEFYQKALELNPRSVRAYNDWGVLLMEEGRLEQAKTCFLQALDLQPDNQAAHCNLGMILAQQGKFPEAIERCRQALKIDAEYATAHRVLGALLLDTGKREEAKEYLAEAVRLDPANPAASCALADALFQEREHEQAAALYVESLRQEADFLPALLPLALIRASSSDPTLRDGDQAVELAMRACQLTRHENPQALDVLGMAYAESGRFSQAVSAAQSALRIARAMGDEALAGSIQRRLLLYQRQVPFRHQQSQ